MFTKSLLGAMLLGATLAAPASAATSYSEQGAILRLDPTAESLVFAYPITSFGVGSSTSVSLDGHAATYADLQPGYTATVTYDSSFDLLSISAHTVPVASFSGPLKSADQRHQSITILLPDGSTRLLWLAGRSTPVTRNGANVQVYQLKSGDHVDVSYRTYTALSVAATGP